MIVHRFMSKQELSVLLAGKQLCNSTNHHKKFNRRTTSIGFCFFADDPDEAVHWLSGIVDLDYCVTMEVDDGFLLQSYGLYMDNETTDLSHPMNYDDFMKVAKFKKRTEYCRSRYSLTDVKILNVTDKYYTMYPPRAIQQDLIKAMLAGVKI